MSEKPRSTSMLLTPLGSTHRSYRINNRMGRARELFGSSGRNHLIFRTDSSQARQ